MIERTVMLTALVCCATTAIADPGADSFGPWSKEPRHPAIEMRIAPSSCRAKLHDSASFGASPFGLAFLLYSRFITQIDGPRCSHSPTCGTYCYRAVAKHGIPLGAWMALARLMRGALSSTLRPLATLSGPSGVYFLDTLEDAEFWLPDYSPMSGLKR